MTEYEKVKNQLTIKLGDFALAILDGRLEGTPVECEREIKEYLSLVEIRAENQDLPELPEFYNDWGGESGRVGYVASRVDMLKAGFVKVAPKPNV